MECIITCPTLLIGQLKYRVFGAAPGVHGCGVSILLYNKTTLDKIKIGSGVEYVKEMLFL
jgi:hypothetical protein